MTRPVFEVVGKPSTGTELRSCDSISVQLVGLLRGFPDPLPRPGVVLDPKTPVLPKLSPRPALYGSDAVRNPEPGSFGSEPVQPVVLFDKALLGLPLAAIPSPRRPALPPLLAVGERGIPSAEKEPVSLMIICVQSVGLGLAPVSKGGPNPDGFAQDDVGGEPSAEPKPKLKLASLATSSSQVGVLGSGLPPLVPVPRTFP